MFTQHTWQSECFMFFSSFLGLPFCCQDFHPTYVVELMFCVYLMNMVELMFCVHPIYMVE